MVNKVECGGCERCRCVRLPLGISSTKLVGVVLIFHIEGKTMKRIGFAFMTLFALAGVAFALQSPDLQQKASAAKEAAARNQQALHAYSWITKTEISVKGEVKNTKVESCKYGPDGKVQKTELTEPPEQQSQRGMKGRMIAKKTGEMKEELEASAALVQKYVPPSADKLQAVIAAGKVSIAPGAATAIRFADYEQSGDALTLTLDSTSKSMQQISVDTWLDKPETKVTLAVTFQSLPDGTNYAAETVLNIPGDNLEVRIENSNYQKVTP